MQDKFAIITQSKIFTSNKDIDQNDFLKRKKENDFTHRPKPNL